MLHSPVDDDDYDGYEDGYEDGYAECYDDDDDDDDDDDVNDVLLQDVTLAGHIAWTLRRARDTLLTGRVAKCQFFYQTS